MTAARLRVSETIGTHLLHSWLCMFTDNEHPHEVGDAPPVASADKRVVQAIHRHGKGEVIRYRLWDPRARRWGPWRRP